MVSQEQFRMSDSQDRWVLGMDSQRGLVHFGLDSEGTGCSQTNLLAKSVKLEYDGFENKQVRSSCKEKKNWELSSDCLSWKITQDGERFIWTLKNNGVEALTNLRIIMPLNALEAATVLIPAGLGKNNNGCGPWLLVAPDYGHLYIEAKSSSQWFTINDGIRHGTTQTAPKTGVDPKLRGQAWVEAANVPDYKPCELNLQFACDSFAPGEEVVFSFEAVEISTPEGIDLKRWKKIRKPYLNHWQPCGTWTDKKRVSVLANNVLSDPASSSLWMYAEPMLFLHEPVKGIDLRVLLKHSLDYWLDNHVSAKGHVNAFGHMYDLYVCVGAKLLLAAWNYWAISADREWLKKRINILHLMADFLLRRDIDKDGIIESIGSGNAGTFHDPDRADIWFEMMNFGHKNTWTNAISYRAFLCLAEMLDAIGQSKGAKYYRLQATNLRDAFVKQFFSKENGWFVSWISQDGQIHDYCHTFINGMAVAYGIVPPAQGREILSKVIKKSKSIGFDNWHLGVPGNLLPCRKGDLIGPRIGIDGNPVKDGFYWPDDLTEEVTFGTRYTNGTIHPFLVWFYLLGLQVAGLDDEADRILNAMTQSAKEGLFQNGIVNIGLGGCEHFYFNGKTCGYEGYLPESFNFLMGHFTRDPKTREKLLGPLTKLSN